MTDETKTALRSREESNSVFLSRVSLLFEKPGNDVRRNKKNLHEGGLIFRFSWVVKLVKI